MDTVVVFLTCWMCWLVGRRQEVPYDCEAFTRPLGGPERTTSARIPIFPFIADTVLYLYVVVCDPGKVVLDPAEKQPTVVNDRDCVAKY